MPDFKVVAKWNRDSVEFYIKDTTDLKEALKLAHIEAGKVFDFKGQGDAPAVSVKPIEPEEGN